jgi:hypothetical protein
MTKRSIVLTSRRMLKAAVFAVMLAVPANPISVAHAEMKVCYYDGKAYSDGAKNDKGQVCDGQTGTWK